MTMPPTAGSGGVLRIEAPDARADGRRRVVLIARDRVVIARGVAGVFMRIALAPGAFRGILLRLASLDETGFHYEIRLLHRDPDLGVELAHSTDEAEARTEWRRWSRFFGLPRLVERTEGTYEPARSRFGSVVAGQPGARRRGRGRGMRRARFLTRRKVGRPELLARPARES